MNKREERRQYERIKAEIKEAVEAIRAKNPEAAAYLEEHLVFNDKKMTFKYTGDDRIKLERILPTRKT